ncbi:hypothetical protein SAMN03080615_01386 [Amphritea atlantica]|uniref:Uncharacterized protein n=1 Tax=Amphritea atlantica TaxID=355243 RepID=A0A1H9FRW5_9GAMM|nr:hypothetical protein [Amphritea atlantica]SEQ40188.1 hypothetical protein SAMN03080615_01386 [Amphritea atlantica]
MKSYLFTTDTDRGGVMLCEIDDFDTAVEYLCNRFDGVVKIESSEQVWQLPEADKPASEAVETEPQSDLSAVATAPQPVVSESADLFG